MVRFSSLGSGSEGNGLLVQVAVTTVLLDCGFGRGAMEQRLARARVRADQVDAILVTHEHSDHIGGVAAFARRHDVPVYASYGTLAALHGQVPVAQLREVEADADFAVGDVSIRPYAVPHDARQPLQFVLGDGQLRLGVLTDVGRGTPAITAALNGCDGLVLECNHDAGMLRAGPYPPFLKERVGGDFGHLANTAAAALLAQLDGSRLQHLVAAHLSRQNNTPALAREALASVVGCTPDWIGVADQDLGLTWRELR